MDALKVASRLRNISFALLWEVSAKNTVAMAYLKETILQWGSSMELSLSNVMMVIMSVEMDAQICAK